MTLSWNSVSLLSLLLFPLMLLMADTSRAQQQHLDQDYYPEGNVTNLNMTLIPTSNTINIVWDAVDGVTDYSIKWSEVSGVATGGVTISENDTDVYTDYTIKNLRPCTEYIVLIQAIQDNLTMDNETDMTQTLAQAPFPVSNLNVTQLDVEDDFATLNTAWSPVEPEGNCNLTYRVTWNSSSTNEAEYNTTTCTEYTITNLAYGTEYIVCVDPWSEDESGNQECEKEITVSSVPGGPPENIMAVTTTTDSIKLKWDPPAAPNGVITNYSITWSPDDGTADTTDTTHTITGLLPCTTYTVTVSAATSKGYGPSGATIVSTSSIALAAPKDLNAVDSTQTEIIVSWNEPAVKPNCFLNHYQIIWDTSMEPVILPPSTKEYTITNLTSGTNYNIFVTAENQAGIGKWAHTDASTDFSGSSVNVGAIVGGVIGGVVVTALVVIVVVKRNALKKMVKIDKGSSSQQLNMSSHTNLHG